MDTDTVFFIGSKLAGVLLKLETWLLILAFVSYAAARRSRPGLAAGASGALALSILVIGLLPLGDIALRPIEASIPMHDETGRIDGIILLGGGEDVPASRAWGQPQTGQGGDRYLAAIALAQQHPEARLLFAGGSGRLRDVGGAEMSEAEIAAGIFAEHGISDARLLFERRSRNTSENARLSRALADPDPGETWVLVTSAFHMPRALESFLEAGWDGILTHPVDYRTRAWGDGLGWSFGRNLELLNTALKEWVGRAAYVATGR